MALICLGLGACGSASAPLGSGSGEGPQLSPARYKVALGTVAKNEFKAQTTLFAALRAGSRAELQKGVHDYVVRQEAVAREVKSLNPPDAARGGNEALAVGLEDTAAAGRQVAQEVAKAPSLKAAIRAVQGSKSRAPELEIREAFVELARAGYTIGA
jgi:hypothetical protein